MNIVLINHYAGSPEMGMEFRPYYFAKEWLKSGNKVSVIAADFSHVRRINPQVSRDFEKQIIDGIDYYWVKTDRYESNGVKRSITMAQFISKLWLKAGWIVKNLRPDAVICSSTYPLDTYVGQRIKKLSPKKVLLVHEVHDMWPISPIEIGGMSPRHPFIKIMQMGENSFCRHADKVVSLLPNAKDYFIRHGMQEDHFFHVPNGIILDEWLHYDKLPESISDYYNEMHSQGKYVITFFGSVNKTYNLDVLINAVKRLNDDKLRIAFIGSGVDRQELINMTAGCESVFSFFEPVAKSSIPDLFNYTDAVFIGAKSQNIFRFGICMNKLFDSMMGGKPILYMVDAPNNYIKEYECGVSVEGQTEDDLIVKLKEIMNLRPEEIQKMHDNGIKAVKERFNYSKLAESFLSILKD